MDNSYELRCPTETVQHLLKHRVGFSAIARLSFYELITCLVICCDYCCRLDINTELRMTTDTAISDENTIQSATTITSLANQKRYCFTKRKYNVHKYGNNMSRRLMLTSLQSVWNQLDSLKTCMPSPTVYFYVNVIRRCVMTMCETVEHFNLREPFPTVITLYSRHTQSFRRYSAIKPHNVIVFNFTA